MIILVDLICPRNNVSNTSENLAPSVLLHNMGGKQPWLKVDCQFNTFEIVENVLVLVC